MIDEVCGDHAYFLACLLASRFDGGHIRYGPYLACVSELLARGYDRDWVDHRISSVLCNRASDWSFSSSE